MALPQHLELFNTPTNKESRSFTLFSRLPAELRLDIWQASLKHGRLVQVKITTAQNDDRGNSDQGEDSLYMNRNTLGNVVSGARYRLTVKAQLYSKLLRVSREARQAALQFYRVHLPCRFRLGATESFGTLHLNPEFDILRVKAESAGHDLVHFLHDVRAHDILRRGLLNVALDVNVINRLVGVDVSVLEMEARCALTETLRGLQQVFFISVERAGRIYLGARYGLHTNDRYEFHRSRPLLSAIPSFDRLAQDPRGNMERDLSRVYAGTFDARQMVCRWRELLCDWDAAHPPHEGPEYRFMVATDAAEIADRETASRWLLREDQRWIDGQNARSARIIKKGYQLPLESTEDLERAPRPTLGFWLFPIEALGSLPEPEAYAEFGWESKRIVDMRQYRPELCLASIT